MTPLSPRQEQIMLTIQRSIATTGQAPTLADLATQCGISSKSRAHGYVSALVALGYLERARYSARAIRVLKPIPDDRFEEAAKAACEALGRDQNADNISKAREAILAALVPEAA